jgi:hypothetical protein
MANTIKPIGAERSIGTANNVALAKCARVINTGGAAVLNFAYANGTVYGNVTVTNTEFVVIEKQPTDTLTGTNMLATPLAYTN